MQLKYNEKHNYLLKNFGLTENAGEMRRMGKHIFESLQE